MKAIKIRVKNFNNTIAEMEYLESLGYKWTATAGKPNFAHFFIGTEEGNILYSPDGRDYGDYKTSHAEVFIDEEFKEVPKHSHYHKDVSHLNTIDVYRVIELWEVTSPSLQHALKKILVPGGRGAGKDMAKDVQEAIDSLIRWQEMQVEDKLAKAKEQC